MRYLHWRPCSWPLLTGLAASVLLLTARSAEADIGIEQVGPGSGVRGQAVDVSVACGACLAISVVRGPLHPPAAFPISLVPVAASNPPPWPNPLRCRKKPRRDGFFGRRCKLHVGPPRDDPFVFLGRARPTFRERDLKTMLPKQPEYRLSFRIPQVAPGPYALVIYCGSCTPGPRGGLIAWANEPDQLLRVRSRKAIASVEHKGKAILWIVTSAGILALGLAGLRLFARRRSRNRIFS